MQPCLTGSVYVNYLGQEADERIERVKAAYRPEKYDRLVALKNTYQSPVPEPRLHAQTCWKSFGDGFPVLMAHCSTSTCAGAMYQSTMW
jgi:hypothetical protein